MFFVHINYIKNWKKEKKIYVIILFFPNIFVPLIYRERQYLILISYENQDKFDNYLVSGYLYDNGRIVIGVSFMSEKPIEKQIPTTIYCNVEDGNSTISVMKGYQVNLTLQDYGDGGYTWMIVTLDEQLLKKESEQTNWGSTG